MSNSLGLGSRRNLKRKIRIASFASLVEPTVILGKSILQYLG